MLTTASLYAPARADNSCCVKPFRFRNRRSFFPSISIRYGAIPSFLRLPKTPLGGRFNRFAIFASVSVPKSASSSGFQNSNSGCPGGWPRFRQYSDIFFFHALDRGSLAFRRAPSIRAFGSGRPLNISARFSREAGAREFFLPRSSLSSVRSSAMSCHSRTLPSFSRCTFNSRRNFATVWTHTPKCRVMAMFDSRLTALIKSPQRIAGLPICIAQGQGISPWRNPPTLTVPRMSQKRVLPLRTRGVW